MSIIASPGTFPPGSHLAEHTGGKRPSTTGKHEKGRARGNRDRGGEKKDEWGRPGRQRPDGHKGSWPPNNKKSDAEASCA